MIRFLRLSFWAAAAFAFIMATLPTMPPLPGEPTDKTLHALAFFTLAVLGSWAYPRLPALKLGIGLCSFGALIEIAQLVPMLNRQTDVGDWVVDAMAAATGLLCVSIARWVVRAPRQTV